MENVLELLLYVMYFIRLICKASQTVCLNLTELHSGFCLQKKEKRDLFKKLEKLLPVSYLFFRFVQENGTNSCIFSVYNKNIFK